MAKFGKLLIAMGAVALAAANTSAASAADASADASARIIQPISIDKTANMNFGEILPSSAAGTVVLGTSGSLNASGGALVFDSSNAQAAAFLVSGEGNEAYTLTLPTSITLSDGENSMTVSSFTSDATQVLNSGGQENLHVGASLGVGANQSAGEYAGSFIVSVDYP